MKVEYHIYHIAIIPETEMEIRYLQGLFGADNPASIKSIGGAFFNVDPHDPYFTPYVAVGESDLDVHRLEKWDKCLPKGGKP
jgi:hypothetical protein